MSNQPDKTPATSGGVTLRSRLWLIVALFLAFVPVSSAQANKAQRAIERLEKCSKQERQSRCVDVLKVEQAGNNKLAVKAQVRGARIIWYEYNKKTGKARRTN